MASDINVVVLVGRLTRNAELRYPQNGGTPSLRFSVAVNRSRRTPDGRWEDEANFFDCVYFTKSAESLSQYLEKGRQIGIQGELRQNRWQDQDGQSRTRVEIFVNNLTLLGGGQRDGASPAQFSRQANPGYGSTQGYGSSKESYTRNEARNVPPQMPLSDGPEDFQDDDIPF